jgi:hypothetical protein
LSVAFPDASLPGYELASRGITNEMADEVDGKKRIRL